MKLLQKVIRFEAVNLTQILIHFVTLGFALIVLLLLMNTFKTELGQFMNTLQNRPIEVTVEESGTTIKLDAPVESQPVAQPIDVPRARTNDPEDWDTEVSAEDNINEMTKRGFSALRSMLEGLDPHKKGALNFVVNSEGAIYYPDREMLIYLSTAAEKIGYLVFYNEGQEFQGLVRIDDVIIGLAASQEEFRDFGLKLIQGGWRDFPGLITRDHAFDKPPTIRELYEKLESGFSELPLLENGRLVGILDYATVSEALYKQVKSV